jgi:hypothetical protein
VTTSFSDATIHNVAHNTPEFRGVSFSVPGPLAHHGWDEVCDQLQKDDLGKWDRIIPRDELRFEEGQIDFPRRYALAGSTNQLKLSDWATNQLCQKLGVPVSYFRRCPTSLRDAQVNYWLRHPEGEAESSDSRGESRWLLRVRGETLRAVLTERYSRVGNAEMVEAISPVLKETGLSVRWFALSDEGVHLRLVDASRPLEVLPGDPVMAGIHLANSEVGKRSLTIDTLVWRLVCKNGLIRLVKGKSIFNRRHIGLSVPELTTALPQAVRRALQEGETVTERFRRATTIHLADPGGVIATLASDWTLSQSLQEKITTALLKENGQQETLYGLVNAVTSVAQALAPDERYALEIMAGTLLETGPPAVRASACSGMLLQPKQELAVSTDNGDTPPTVSPQVLDHVPKSLVLFPGWEPATRV